MGKALREGDIKTLIELQEEALKKFAVFKAIEPLITPATIQRWEITISKLVEELKIGLNTLKQINQQLCEFDNGGKYKLELQFFQSPKGVSYIKGLEEVFKLLKRFNVTLNHFAKSQNVSLSKFQSFLVNGDSIWKEISSFLSGLNISVRFNYLINLL